jgi:Family of unknown function (DUF6214)
MTWAGTGRVVGRGSRPVFLGQTLVPAEAVWEFSGEDGEPDVFARFEVRDGRPECVELRLLAKPDGRGLRTSDLGLWQLDNFAINVFATLGEPLNVATASAEPPRTEAGEWIVRRDVTEARLAKRGTPGVEDLKRVADIYRRHLDSGAPVRAVSAALGLSSRTASRRVEQAREAGLLPATTRGKAKA